MGQRGHHGDLAPQRVADEDPPLARSGGLAASPPPGRRTPRTRTPRSSAERPWSGRSTSRHRARVPSRPGEAPWRSASSCDPGRTARGGRRHAVRRCRRSSSRARRAAASSRAHRSRGRPNHRPAVARLPLPLAACEGGAMDLDPAVSNPQHYTVVFENDRVRVLLYRDRPGEQTTPHRHPDSVMYTLSSFERRLRSGGAERDVTMDAGVVAWLPAQEHHGLNTGDTETHVLFVERGPGREHEVPRRSAPLRGPPSLASVPCRPPRPRRAHGSCRMPRGPWPSPTHGRRGCGWWRRRCVPREGTGPSPRACRCAVSAAGAASRCAARTTTAGRAPERRSALGAPADGALGVTAGEGRPR